MKSNAIAADSLDPPGSQHTSDKEIVTRILGGDSDSLRILIQRYEKKLAAYLLKRCQNSAQVDDLLQETFIAAYKDLAKYNQSLPFSAWLFGIARNKANDFYRKSSTLLAVEDVDPVDEESPLHLLDHKDFADHFWIEVRRALGENQFTAIWLRYQEGLSVKEISQTMEESASNIKILLFRARKALSQSSILSQWNCEPHLHQSNC